MISERGHRMISRVALSALGILALLVLAESAARIILTKRPGADRMDHPYFGAIRPPGMRQERQDLGEKFLFRTNQLGFRGAPMSTRKEEGVYRVILVGASMVEARYLPEEKTLSSRLEHHLNEHFRGNPRIEVGNLSYPGATSWHSLAQIANRVLFLQPDLILESDATEFLKWLSPGFEPTLMYLRPFRQSPIEQLLWSSRIYAWIRGDIPDDLRLMRGAQERRRATPFKDPAEADLLRGLDRTRVSLHRSALLTRDAGAEFALFTHAFLYKDNQPEEEDRRLWQSYLPYAGYNLRPGTARRSADALNSMIRDLARSEKIPLIDGDRKIPRDLQHFIDDCHLTEAGLDLLAREAAEVLIQSGKIKTGKAKGPNAKSTRH